MALDISSDASKVLSGASQGAMAYVTANAPGGKLTSGEAQSLLSQYNASPQAALDAKNISATTANPTPAPDDLLGIRSALSTQLGISDKQAAYESAYSALKNYDLETENAARLINEQQLSTNVLSGQEATARKLRASERLSLANEAEIAQAALIAAREELNTQFGIRSAEVQNMRSLILSNPDAGITFSDTTESARKKIADYNKKVQKAAEEKQKEDYKDQLKSTLMSLGISTKSSKGGSLSTKKMEAALTAYYKEQGYKKSQIDELEMQIKRKQLSGVGETNKNEKLAASLQKDADTWKAQMRAGKATWSDAWNSIVNTYGFDPNNQDDVNAVDNILGAGAYRSQYDVSPSELSGYKTGGGLNIDDFPGL